MSITDSEFFDLTDPNKPRYVKEEDVLEKAIEIHNNITLDNGGHPPVFEVMNLLTKFMGYAGQTVYIDI